MIPIEIPLLRESTSFVKRLMEASLRFGETKSNFRRRVNWSYRYATCFYQAESELFRAGPEAYLANRIETSPRLEDVLPVRIGRKQMAKTLLKVAAHWLFYFLGRTQLPRIRKRKPSIWRKGYVDDIEMVFDPGEAGVVRAIFPFPINIGRQRRYLRHLREKRYVFKLDGNPYGIGDLMRFVIRRDVGSLMRMETRAQVRHAFEVAALGVRTVQLSDEFDLGSLDFCRTLARFPIHVVNSAHGSGKYFPVHAYREFHVITRRQSEYYLANRPCKYVLRQLNDKSAANVTLASREWESAEVRFVFLSQVFAGISEIIPGNEARVLRRMAEAFSGSSKVKLFYRPHPNCHQPVVPEGFERLWRLEEVNGRPGTVFASFFSTCHVDPSFKGRKILVRGDLIFPEISYDDDGDILNVEDLIKVLQNPAYFRESDLHPTMVSLGNTQEPSRPWQ